MRTLMNSLAATSLVCVAAGDECGDLFLGWSQLPAQGARPPIRASSVRACFRPEAGAEAIEGGKRSLEGRRATAFSSPGAGSTKREERAAELEGPRDTLVLLDGLFDRSQRAGKIAARGEQQPAAAAAATADSRPVEPQGAGLVRLQQRGCLVHATERDQRLDVVVTKPHSPAPGPAAPRSPRLERGVVRLGRTAERETRNPSGRGPHPRPVLAVFLPERKRSLPGRAPDRRGRRARPLASASGARSQISARPTSVGPRASSLSRLASGRVAE